MRIKEVVYGPADPKAGETYGWVFWCPGCRRKHHFVTNGAMRWEFDGNTESPTFSPSLLNMENSVLPRCHLFLRHGVLQFLSDSQHDHAGCTVPLPELPEEEA